MSTKGNSDIFHIKIHCAQCNGFLFKYEKRMKGALLRCYIDQIADDATGGNPSCPGCGQEFARLRIIKGRTAFKIIQGKIFIKGHLKK